MLIRMNNTSIQVAVGTKWTDAKGRTWEVIEDLHFGRFRVRTTDFSRLGEMQGASIRKNVADSKKRDLAYGAFKTIEEYREWRKGWEGAYAALMAAAPDLLALALAIVEWHADVNGSGERLDEFDDMAKAAIRKVEGR